MNDSDTSKQIMNKLMNNRYDIIVRIEANEISSNSSSS